MGAGVPSVPGAGTGPESTATAAAAAAAAAVLAAPFEVSRVFGWQEKVHSRSEVAEALLQAQGGGGAQAAAADAGGRRTMALGSEGLAGVLSRKDAQLVGTCARACVRVLACLHARVCNLQAAAAPRRACARPSVVHARMTLLPPFPLPNTHARARTRARRAPTSTAACCSRTCTASRSARARRAGSV